MGALRRSLIKNLSFAIHPGTPPGRIAPAGFHGGCFGVYGHTSQEALVAPKGKNGHIGYLDGRTEMRTWPKLLICCQCI